MQHITVRPHSESTALPERLANGVEIAIRTRLAVLRASLESLVKHSPPNDSRAVMLKSALNESVCLGREVAGLIDHAFVKDLRPTSCSLEEIASSVLQFLPPSSRAQVLVAIEGKEARLRVDADQLARALARLIDAGLADGSETALFAARHARSGAAFSFVRAHTRIERTAAKRNTEAGLVLGVNLARRDIERMGGTLSLEGGLERDASWTAFVPERSIHEDMP